MNTHKDTCCEKCAPSKDVIPEVLVELRKQGRFGCWIDNCHCHQESPQTTFAEKKVEEFREKFGGVKEVVGEEPMDYLMKRIESFLLTTIEEATEEERKRHESPYYKSSPQ